MKKDRIITHAYNLAYYSLKLWEKIVLYFVDLETTDKDGTVMTYKVFRRRMYIYSIRHDTYMSGKKSDGGVNTPWMN